MALLDTIFNFLGYTKKEKEEKKKINFLDLFSSVEELYPLASTETFIQTYFNNVWIFRCCDVISSTIAKIPVNIYRQKGNEKVKVENENINNLFVSPNEFTSWYDLIEETVTLLLLSGSAYWWIDDKKNPTMIYSLNPAKMKIVPSRDKFIDHYLRNINGLDKREEVENILHFKSMNPISQLYGTSIIQPAQRSVILDLYALAYKKKFFRQGANLSGILSTDQTLNDEQFERIKKMWSENYEGIERAYRTAVLEAGLKFTPLQVLPKDTGLTEDRKLTREEILAGFGVPPILVGILDQASYANANIQYKIYYNNCIIPKLQKLEHTINFNFLNSLDCFIEFDLSAVEVLKEDEEQKAKIDIMLVNAGLRMINEIRRRDKLAEVPWGDTWWKPISLMAFDEEVTEEKNLEKQRKQPLRQKILYIHRERLRKYENMFFEYLKKIFSKQEKIVLNNLKAIYKQENIIDKILFDLNKENKRLAVLVKALYLDIFENVAVDKFKDLGQDMPEGFMTRKINNVLNKRMNFFIDEVNKTTIDQLKETLREGYDKKETVEEIRKRIQKVFIGTSRGSAPRARAIARTEMSCIINTANFETFKRLEAGEKEWIAAGPPNDRDWHTAMDGERVPFDEPFSNGLYYPGDPNGGPEEIIGCRCTFSGVLK